MAGFHDGREAALHAHIKSLPPSTFHNSPKALLDAIDTFAVGENHMIIFQKPKVDASRQFLQRLNPKPKVLVELGGYIGKSAVAWGDMLRSFHANNGDTKDVKVFSMELEPDFIPIIRDFVSITGLEGTVEAVQGPSEESLKTLKNERGIDTIDVLFLDHWEECYLPDLRTCEELRMLKVGSVLVADNTDKPGAPEYLRYVEAGGESGYKYRCESVVVDAAEGAPKVVHFSYVEATP